MTLDRLTAAVQVAYNDASSFVNEKADNVLKEYPQLGNLDYRVAVVAIALISFVASPLLTLTGTLAGAGDPKLVEGLKKNVQQIGENLASSHPAFRAYMTIMGTIALLSCAYVVVPVGLGLVAGSYFHHFVVQKAAEQKSAAV